MENNRAEQQARVQVETCVELMELWEELQNGAETVEWNGQEYDEHELREAIDCEPLSLQVRTGWYSPGYEAEPEEYELLMCTGGPAVRIIGELGEWNEPSSARVQYQDWFTPWQEYLPDSDERERVLEFTRMFYYGE